ncbi:MAG: hypothetical protein KDD53_11725, partial [Bdellovibrionales bacterium]|nr:hypothetical protein [Bdellovibrionales bacterium]
WLRITNKYRFDNRIKKVLSYYRMYEENKTGQGMSPLLPEMSKLFKKYESKYTGDQFPVYCIIPINECDKSVASTLRSIAEQSESTTAVALVGYNHSKQFASELELFSSEMQEKFPQLYIETHIEGSSYFEAVNLIAPHCQSPLLLVLEPGDFLEPNFIQEFIKIFQNDRVGFILPWGNRPVLKDLVLAGDESKRHFAIESLFKPLGLPFHFGVRKLAFTELEGFRSARSPLIALQEMIFRLSDHSWWVNVINTLNIKSKITLAERKASCEIFRNFINAHILVEIERDHEETPFAKVRFREGFSLRFPDALTKRSGGLLKAAPQDWHTLEFAETLDSLLETTAKYPHFSPGWYFLEQKYSDYGQIEMAKIAEAKYNFSKEHELKH